MISETGFWNIKKNSLEFEKEHAYDSGLGEEIVKIAKLNKFNNVYDFGCGRGDYTKKLNDNNILCTGFDGNEATKEIENCKVFDLTNDLQLEKTNLIICLEVGEHIPQKYENKLLENINNNLENGGKLILSWAIIGQGGLGHVNCRNNDYIIKKLTSHYPFLFNENESNEFRKNAKISYFKKTIMIFDKKL